MRLDYQPLDNEEVKEIDPNQMEFVFELSREECHLKATGKCSLDRWFKPFGKDPDGDASYEHCRNILTSIRREGVVELIDIIYHNGCGHHAFIDGQHRTCLAKRKNIVLKAIVTTEDSLCQLCRKKAGKDAELG